MTKKFLSMICVILSLAMLLCACGGDKEESKMENVGSQLDYAAIEATNDAIVGTEPQVTEPQQTEPAVTEPQQTESAVTEPQAATPQETQSQVVATPQETQPQVVTTPQETEPAATAPATPPTDDQNTGKGDSTTTAAPVTNEFFNDANNILDPGKVSIRPRHMYWDGNVLVAQCFVMNGTDKTVSNINVKRLGFGNNSGSIASGYFDVLQGVTLKPNEHILWTFYFGPELVSQQGADLSSVSCSSSCGFNY